MRLSVNGEVGEWRDGVTVRELVLDVAGSERGVAVSIDRAVVPRSAWATTTVHEGAAIEVLSAAAGG